MILLHQIDLAVFFLSCCFSGSFAHAKRSAKHIQLNVALRRMLNGAFPANRLLAAHFGCFIATPVSWAQRMRMVRRRVEMVKSSNEVEKTPSAGRCGSEWLQYIPGYNDRGYIIANVSI